MSDTPNAAQPAGADEPEQQPDADLTLRNPAGDAAPENPAADPPPVPESPAFEAAPTPEAPAFDAPAVPPGPDAQPYAYPAPPSGDVNQPWEATAGYQQPPAGYAPPGYPQQGYAPPGYPQGYGQPGYPQGYGQPGYAPYAGVEQKSKIAAGLLGIFLGSLGIHNFYLGFTGKAIAQLLITVLSLGFLSWASAIWGIIEGILILTGSENFRKDAKGIPLRD
ncbi:TM2 domain-containing protein [Specibacter cremeus]|uniref:TM2 domain-containing protein n=1 Tax=Specibacter cremeus TaxID=1629051 RepID=UPI000F77B57C|nr:TM2 domain-containing protein [Specibacter cremeus]